MISVGWNDEVLLESLYPRQAGAAWFSADKRYRHALSRSWDLLNAYRLAPAVFCMLNPSKAGAVENDATIRRCVGYAKTWGTGGIVVVNLYDFIATDPLDLDRELARHHVGSYGLSEPGAYHGLVSDVGNHVIEGALRIARAAKYGLIAAWGATDAPGIEYRVEFVKRAAALAGVPLTALKRTASGQPSHPLRLAKDLVPGAWP